MAFTSKLLLWMLLDHGYVQSFCQQLKVPLLLTFKGHLTVEYFTDMDQHTC